MKNQLLKSKTMKNPLFVCSLAIAGMQAINEMPAQSWTQKTNFAGTAREGAVGFSIGNKGYLGTGYDGTAKMDFWEYNPAIDVWTQKANFAGTARSEAVGFSIGSKGYIGTGWTGSNAVNDFWEYDTAINVWTQRANFAGPRSEAVGFSIGNKGFIGTGTTDNGITLTNDFWEYDPLVDAWIQRTNFPGTARREAAGFSIGSKGYIGTGWTGSNAANDFWEYDIAVNAWIQKANFNQGVLSEGIGFAIGNKGYIGTGKYLSLLQSHLLEFNPAANVWTSIDSSCGGGPRTEAVGFAIGNKGYIGTGNNGNLKEDFWQFDPNGNPCFIPSTVAIIAGNTSICQGTITTISAMVTGGVPPYTYQWSPPSGLTCSTCNSGGANPTVTTTYTVLVTDNAGSTATDVETITVTNALFIASVSATNTSCYGSANGSAKATASCGTAPYSYAWSPAGQTTQTASGLSAGTHTVIVTDANSATATQIVTISQPPPFVITLPLIQICSGTCANINAWLSGGTAPYNYQWSNGATVAAITVCPTVSTSYSFSVTDANGCTTADIIPVTVNPTPTITISGSSVSCGTTTLCASGGTTYYWSTGNTVACIAVNPSVPTQYYVWGYDANGCSDSASFSITPVVIVTTTVSNTSCTGNTGTATALASGNAPPYTYLWSNGQTTQQITGLPVGTYTVTVTDANGCISIDTASITQPAGPTVVVQTNSSAGTATATVSGGTMPYAYVWNTNPAQNTQTATGLVPGNYAVCVTDSNGCTGCSSFVIGQSACSNFDFENGDFSNFTGESGLNFSGNPISWTGGLVQGSNDAPVSGAAQHTILTINTLDTFAIDPVTNLPDVFMTTLAPNGGNFSVRLGNSMNGGQAEGLKISFPVVSASDTIFTYQFADVMEDPGHSLTDQPGFMVNVYDANGQKDITLSQIIYAKDPAYPFIVSPKMGPNSANIVYRRWQGLSINLSAYVGQAVTIEFANFDCALLGHMGYTYLDGSCFGKLIADVWPGDCDYDLHANNVDLLSLGLAYGATGTARSGASNNWVAQPSADWTQAFTLGANYKHSDCNGDGAVNADDTLAISLNYNNTHPFKMQQPIYNSDLPDMYLTATADSVGPNSLVNVDIMLGRSIKPVDSIYAIAFTITYDPAYFLNAFTAGANFNSSWLGAIGNNMITLQKNLFSSGQIDLALTRTDHSNVSGGNGKIGTFSFRTTPVTSVIPGNIQLMITGVKAITATGRIISLNTLGDNVFFDPAMLDIPSYLNPDLISVFPNPASDNFTVTLPFGMEHTSVELLNLIGQSVMTVKNVKQAAKLDVSSLPAGMYQMKISCDRGTAMKKIQVAR